MVLSQIRCSNIVSKEENIPGKWMHAEMVSDIYCISRIVIFIVKYNTEHSNSAFQKASPTKCDEAKQFPGKKGWMGFGIKHIFQLHIGKEVTTWH